MRACLVRNEPTSPELIYSRENLDLLVPDLGQLKGILSDVLACYYLGIGFRKPITDIDKKRLNKIEKGEITRDDSSSHSVPEWKDHDVQTFGFSLLKMINKRGTVKRGNNVKRLYSPLTNLMREFRHGFTFAGSSWVNLDMTCSQPTILAYECDDAALIQDCLNNSFYGKIAVALDSTRDEAKRAYCAYAYGENRSERSTNKIALQVQDFMKGDYPKTFKYIWENKKDDHSPFIRRMQDKEAEIFVDGVYSELQRRNIVSLTIHDSIFTTSENEDEVKEIMEKELTRKGIEQVIKVETKKEERGRDYVRWFWITLIIQGVESGVNPT